MYYIYNYYMYIYIPILQYVLVKIQRNVKIYEFSLSLHHIP